MSLKRLRRKLTERTMKINENINMNPIELALTSNIIQFNEDRSTITYVHQKINRNYNNPEKNAHG